MAVYIMSWIVNVYPCFSFQSYHMPLSALPFSFGAQFCSRSETLESSSYVERRDRCIRVSLYLGKLRICPQINLSHLAFQKHWDFYHSLLKVCCNTPRTLMHLSRCAIRKALHNRCHKAIPMLSLPLPLKKYLLLEPEGIIY